MLKKIVLPLLLLSAIPTINADPLLPKEVTLEQVQKADKEILWDIHNVIAQKEGGSKWAKTASFFKTAPKWELTKALVNFNLWKDIRSLPKSADASGEAYVAIFAKRNFSGLAAAVEQLSNAYKPREGMLELVKKLDEKGVTQRFASNIGPRLLQNLNAKFKAEYGNDILDYIKPGKIVSYDGQTGDHLASIGKPDDRFYKELNATYPAKMKVFIDDKLENTQRGVQNDWVGINFDLKSKDPMADLYKDLRSVGFDIQ